MPDENSKSDKVICSACGAEIEIGMFPFCKGNPSDHIPSHWRSGEIDPIVVHQNPSTGEFSFPGRTDDEVPAGYIKREIKSIREYEKFRREWEGKELDMVQAQIHEEYDVRSAAIRERREQVKASLRRVLGKDHSKLFDMVQVYVDQKRQARYDRLMRQRPNCHARIIEFDGNNQNISRFRR